ncbi:serine hydrolase [Candidatus Sumerlaeota bacterium]|nr:serine hydrolase [Candidatus Sumerlaeota bacterium]
MTSIRLIRRMGIGSLIAILFAAGAARGVDFDYLPAKNAGLNLEALKTLQALLEETHTHSACVLYKGKLVCDWNWNAEGDHSIYEAWSTSKSIASTCIGLLVDEGKIGSVDDPVSKYIPSWGEGDKAKVTLRHLLQQTSGLEEKPTFPMAQDQLKMCLEAPILTPPGEVGRYNNAGCNVLSAIISAASGGLDPEAYIKKKLWEPMGIHLSWWRRDAAGHVITYAGVQTTAIELASVGQLFLNGGTWNGQRLISKDWIEQATTKQAQLTPMPGIPPMDYGWLWWVDIGAAKGVPHNYNSLGLFGNNMTVIPDLQLVGVRLVGSDREGGALMMRTPEWVEKLAAIVPAAGAAASAGNQAGN